MPDQKNTNDAARQEKIEEILKFWFEDTTAKQKYAKDEAFDALIREQFLDTYWAIMRSETKHWRATADGRLAEIIVLDQFARNMFRDDKQSFAGDDLALQLAEEAIAIGADQEMPVEQRTNFYMPYMHSESKAIHEEALKIFETYGNKGNLEYEIKHKAIIDRFGRYPHRNKVLGRESTPEEIEFLKEHSGF